MHFHVNIFISAVCQVFNASIPRRVFDRLLYITCSQNWEAMVVHFWIKQCIEVSKEYNSNETRIDTWQYPTCFRFSQSIQSSS